MAGKTQGKHSEYIFSNSNVDMCGWDMCDTTDTAEEDLMCKSDMCTINMSDGTTRHTF